MQAVRLLSTGTELAEGQMYSLTRPDASDKLWAIAQRSFAVLLCLPVFHQVVLHTHHLGCVDKIMANFWPYCVHHL